MENQNNPEKIARGDVVILKSGGPKMTVQSTGEAKPGPMGIMKWVTCIWISADHSTVCEHTFNEVVLKKADAG